MVSGEAGWPSGGDAVGTAFAGELFLTLAAEGRLVVDAVKADEIEALMRG